MEVIIHRGTHQIGGCVTEIKTDKTRIIIDFGSELNSASPSVLDVPGVTDLSKKCDAVFLTHYHLDHIGQIGTIKPKIPIYIGRLSKQILFLSNKLQHLYDDDLLQSMNTFDPGVKILVGDIKITAFGVDHSACDAYMFLIEAKGKKILHTGDFRAHGFRGKGLSKVLDRYIGKVDALICEGTVLNRNSNKSMTEYELSRKAALLLKNNKYVFVICASTNIDRIAALYSAIPKGKYCLCDGYQKDIINLIENDLGPFSTLYQFPKALIYGTNLDSKIERSGFCMFIRLGNPKHRRIMEQYKSRNPLIIYSMWQGYLTNAVSNNYLKGFNVERLHTSGHADYATLKMVIDKTKPNRIIPIHTEAPEKMVKVSSSKSTIPTKDKEIIII